MKNAKLGYIKFQTGRLRLRPASTADAAHYLDYLLKNYNWFATALPDLPENYYSFKGVFNLLKQEEDSLDKGAHLRLIINPKEEYRILGDISVWAAYGTVMAATLGYKLDKACARMGYMREALEPVIKHIFEDLKLHKIEANILPENSPSIKLLQSLGFRYEGMNYSSFKRNSKWRDQYRFSLLNPEL